MKLFHSSDSGNEWVGKLMRVLITGGSGLIGVRLCQLLKKDHHELIVLSRDPQTAADHLPAGVQVRWWDGATPQGWGDLVNRETVFINLAGACAISGLWSPDQAEAVLESRLAAADAIAEAVDAAPEKPYLLLQASSVDYYGDGGDDMLIEESPVGDDWRARLVAQCEAATADIPVRQLWLRLGMVLDPHRTVLPELLGGDGQWISWVHNDDVARAIRFLLAKENASGPVNLVAPYPATAACFRRALTEIRHATTAVPVALVHTALQESQRVLPQKLTMLGFPFFFEDAEDALRALSL
ncbi:MAG: hypothetical protein CL610_26975 [Anaerolineaceae bacterium]|nr:hypothetical protein [Anaerolineaceae bacterium]